MRVAAGICRGVEANQVEHFVDPGADAGTVPTEQVRDSSHVVGDRQVGEKPGLLDHVARPPSQLDRVDRCDVLPIDDDTPARRLYQAVHHPQDRRFAAPRRPDQDAQLARRHLQVEVLNGVDAVAVVLGHCLEADHVPPR